jgi:peptidoglycan/xylan/chitin deacetylase (PgdA/CDA1 family)
MKKIILILLVFLSPNTFSENIKIVFRYDDFILQNDSISEQIVHVFQKHNIPLVLGIIPCDSSENFVQASKYPFINTLKQGLANGSLEMALHGYNHLKLSNNGEFGNVPLSEQYRRMMLGKHYLDSVFHQKTTTFIPPWNAYDGNTLEVMDKLGIKVISSALTINQPCTNEKIDYFPHTIGHPQLLIPILESNKYRSGIIVLMFHQYDINNHFSVNDLDVLLSKLHSYSGIEFSTFKGLLAMSEKSDAKRFYSNLETNLLYKIMKLKGVFYSIEFAMMIRILNVIFYLFIVSFFYFLPFIFSSNFRKLGIKMVLFIDCLLITNTGFFVWFHLLGPDKLLFVLSIFALSCSWGLFVVLNYIRSKHEA